MEKSEKLILFGATGDLAKAKILPALAAINVEPALYGRKEFYHFNYMKGELDEIAEKIKDQYITHAYVALPPMYFETVLRQLAMLPQIPRIALEKPFGTSYEDALYLLKIIKELNLEEKVYLVDHYIGKPALINPDQLDLNKIKSIDIDAFETQNVEGRGAFYDAVGTIKDFVQNHIMMIISKLCEPYGLDHLVYRKGSILTGQYEGFRMHTGVDSNSKTETFVSLHFLFDNHIDIRVRVGKAMDKAKTEAKVIFNDNSEKTITIQSTVNSYEVIIKDFLANESVFKLSFEESLLCWRITEEILKDKEKLVPIIYPQGSSVDQIV